MAILSRLNDYRDQYVHYMYEKWEICNVVLEEVTYETRAILEVMRYGGIWYLSFDDVWNLFESLASYQRHYECATEYFICPSPPLCALHSQSSRVD